MGSAGALPLNTFQGQNDHVVDEMGSEERRFWRYLPGANESLPILPNAEVLD